MTTHPTDRLAIEFLFTLRLEDVFAREDKVDSAIARRRVRTAAAGTVNGPALTGRMASKGFSEVATAALPDGPARLEGGVLLVGEDEAPVLMQYYGRADGGAQFIAPLFEAGPGRYEWLNGVQAIGYGHRIGDALEYDFYALLGEAEGPAYAPVEFLMHMVAESGVGERFQIKSPLGMRYMSTAPGGGRFEGPRIAGTLLHDWAPHRSTPDLMLMHYDVTLGLETDDGIPILMNYMGVNSMRYLSHGEWRTAPIFEVAADSAHGWLNAVMGIGFGKMDGERVIYDLYRLLPRPRDLYKD